jgi:adenylate kinase
MEVIRDRVHNRVTCQNCGTAFNLGRHVQSLEEPCPQCGGKLERRTDDTLAALEKRMAQYHELTEPLIPYYREQGLLTQIDANRDSEAVFADVADFLKVPLHA